MSRRILFVTLALPHPPDWGAATRNYQLIRNLAGSHEVSLVSFTRPVDQQASIDHLRGVCRVVRTVPAPAALLAGKRLAQLRSLAGRTSYTVAAARSRELAAAVAEVVASERPDLIQVEASPLAQLPVPRGPRLLLDEHNIEYELLARMAAAESRPDRKLYNTLEARKFERAEVAAWRRFDGLTFTSEREREVAAARSGAATAVVPNGVDPREFRSGPGPTSPGSIVFTGIQSYRPNTDAVLFFNSEVLPRVMLARPDAVFSVVGQRPPREVENLASEHVRVTGRVPDVRPYLERAEVVVAPLRMGGGTRLKILEALAMGKSVVTTSLGCEGLEVEPGVHLLVADGAAAFAEAVLRLLANPGLRAELGRQGRRLVERRYDWRAIALRLDDFQRSLLGSEPAQAPASSGRWVRTQAEGTPRLRKRA